MTSGYWGEVPRYIPHIPPTLVGAKAVQPESEIKYVPCDLPGPGQGFQVDPTRLRSVAEKWLDLAYGFRSDQALTDALINVEGPAPDYASVNSAAMFSRAGHALKNALINREVFCLSQARKYRELAEQYENFDRESANLLRKIGGK